MELTARDIMITDVICVPQDMDLRELTKLFLERGITGAPVIDEQGNLAGVISQHDLLYYTLTRDDELTIDSSFYENVRLEGHRLPPGFQVEDVNSGRVSDVMTPVVHSVSESASLDRVARLMTRKHIHRVIVKRGRRVAGIISALDVLRVLGDDEASPSRNGGSRPRAKPKAPRRRDRG